MPFLERLEDAITRTAPLCAGIDPSPAQLASWGLEDSPTGLAEFVARCLDGFCDAAAIVKPQVAFFERFGAAGFAVLEALLEAASERGVLVLADAKRGDISTTIEAYADAWLAEGSPLAADAVTATAYLGLGALEPLFDQAVQTGRGVFVVVESSNPEGRALQRAQMGATTVAGSLYRGLAEYNRTTTHGALGAVVGATNDVDHQLLASLGGAILAPGLGAQGATPGDLGDRFGGLGIAVLASASRSLLLHGPDPAALAAATRALGDEVRAALG